MAKPAAKLFSMLTPKRRWAQFSVATMMIVVTVLCVWLALRGSEAQRKQEAIAAALNETTDIDFTDQPFDGVIAYLKAKHKIEIELDDKALADAGIGKNVVVTRYIKGITLRSALDQLLRDLDLTFNTRGGALFITTTSEAKKILLSIRYPITPPLYRPESPGSENELIDAIRSTIEPASWDESGGPGTIRFLPPKRCLVIEQTQQVHREIARLLGMLAEPESPPQQSASVRAIAAALDEQTNLDFTDLPVWDLVESLKAKSDIEIQIDFKSFDEAGIDGSTTVTYQVNGVALRSALKELLDELDLTTIVRDETLVIITKTEADQVLDTRVYPIAPHLHDAQSPQSADELIDHVVATIVPDSWEHLDGRGTIRFFPPTNCLIVSQSEKVHDELRKRLSP